MKKEEQQEVLRLLDIFLKEKKESATVREFKDLLQEHKYYHVTDLDDVDWLDFDREAEDRGYVMKESIIEYPDDIIAEVVKTKTKVDSAFNAWKVEAVLDNLDKFTQEEFETWINTK